MKVKFGAIATGEAVPEAGELGTLTVTGNGGHKVVHRRFSAVWTERSYSVAVRRGTVDSLSPEFVSRKDARRLLGISDATLDRMLHRTSAAPALTPPNAQTARKA
jgi:hypothetical protein